MPGSFSGIEIGSRALQAFQYALDVTGHNVSNVNTAGYSRQRIRFASQNDGNASYGRGNFQLGNGVDIANVDRIRDIYLEQRLRSSTSDASKSDTLNGQLKQIETFFNDTSGKGITSQIDGLFNSFHDLAANPSNSGIRTIVRDNASQLVQSFHSLSSDLSHADANLTTQINGQLAQVNDLSSKIADLNKAISLATASGATPNDLLDKRDGLIKDLSGLTDIDVRPGKNNTVDVFTGQVTLVRADEASPIPNTLNVVTGTLTDGTQTIKLSGGSLGGLLQTQQNVHGYQTSLDKLASSLITRTNAVHEAGSTLNNTTNVDFFSGNSAASIDISTLVKSDLNNIAAGGPIAPTSPPNPYPAGGVPVDLGVKVAAGDGTQANALANLRTESQAALGNTTFTGAYANIVNNVGTDSQNAAASLDTQGALANQLQNFQDSVSGVSLDEEMTNMMKYQRSYQAAARIISTFDQVLQYTLDKL